MIIKSLSVFCLLICFVACNNQTQETQENIEPQTGNITNCYRSIKNNDTISLITKDSAGMITGTLLYALSEKDKNTGTIQGNIKDNLLVANYTFMSEGTISVRQVAFKKTANGFIEGYGNVEDKDGKMIFKNTDSLTFNNTSLLTSIDCE
ncbi:MAG: hypothetical protein ABJA35_04750 [Parafilimonas sp.]